jgi:hypothetical protein
LAERIRIFIAREGYDVSPTAITEIVQQDSHLIPQSVFDLLVSNGYDKNRVGASIARGANVFKPEVVLNGTNGHATRKNKPLNEIWIDDVEEFRKTLELGDTPSPVVPLETYYEAQSPKL